MNQIWVKIGQTPISIDAVLASGSGEPGRPGEINASQGAEVIFHGVVRANNLGRKVLGVSYDAFEPLAEKVLREIGEEAAHRWGPDVSVLIQHRTGRLKVGEASVLIVTRSPHRAEAYAVSRYVIDELKTRAPIWKQEHYEEGNSQWLQGHALCQHSGH